MRSNLSVEKYFDAIIENKISIVQQAPQKYHKCFDKREQSNQVIQNIPAIFYAIFYHRDDILTFLLDNKAPLFNKHPLCIPRNDQPDPLQVNKETSALIFSLCINNENATKTLLTEHPELLDKYSKLGTTALEVAVRFNKQASAFLWKNKAIVNRLIAHQNNFQMNPLQTACIYGRLEILQFWRKMIDENEELKPNFYKAALMLNDNYNNIVELADQIVDLDAFDTTEFNKQESFNLAQTIMQEAMYYAEQYQDFNPQIKHLLQQITNVVHKKPKAAGQLLTVTDTAYNDEEYIIMQNELQQQKVDRMKKGEHSEDLD
ncbi:Conserved_hypothetical protein [Hexamita inflata]|uniref:Ankyrin repeat-containing protein n=1 Tax=Hexamita inflata TaxID=28002 RepID=A0AA86QW83_9EUKA|nr:Conserved hypothetical protein [Hexamita inflata]